MTVIASMATLPNRTLSMKQAIASLLPQVDELHVTLNGHAHPPTQAEELQHPAVRLCRLEDNIGARAKLNPAHAPRGAIRLLVDDDIVYPPDYVATLREALERYPRCLVGVHGALVRWPIKSYAESLKIVAHFTRKIHEDRYVHVLGTGTMAFRADEFNMRPEALVAGPNSVDVSVACWARERGLGLVAIRRRDHWLRPIGQPKGETIWETRALAGKAGYEEYMLRNAGPWPEGGLRPR